MNVRQLHTPNPERSKSIKAWHGKQAVSDVRPVSALHVAITEDGLIHTHSLHIGPEMALIIIDELDRVRAVLCQQVVEEAPELLGEVYASPDQPSNVVALKGMAWT